MRKRIVDNDKSPIAPAAIGTIILLGLLVYLHVTTAESPGTGIADVVSGLLVVILAALALLMFGAYRRLTRVTREHERDQRLIATLLRHSHEGVIIMDADFHVTGVNDTFTRITGYEASEITGKHVMTLSSERHDAQTLETIGLHIVRHGHWSGLVFSLRKNGEEYPQQLTIQHVPGTSGRDAQYVTLFLDVSDRTRIQEELTRLTTQDALTGLPNPQTLRDIYEHATPDAHLMAVLLLDLDGFKLINDSFGHDAGNVVLQDVAARLKQSVRDWDHVARPGGDEFILLLTRLPEPAMAGEVASRLLECLTKPVQVGQYQVTVPGSIGISIHGTDGTDWPTLLKNADTAMYRAKEQGRNTFQYYQPDMNERALGRLVLENDLRHALPRGEFRLVYQPQIDLQDGQITGVEALLRWQHPERGMISPAEFIPLAEETGLIIGIGAWVVQEATRQVKAWIDAGLPEVRVAVNVSALQFQRSDMVAIVQRALETSGLPSHLLELEFTESVVMNHTDGTLATLRALQKLGVRLSVDDFGTGYSSLSYLGRFPVDVVKIDQSFVRRLQEDPEHATLVRAVIALARTLSLRTLAEGVETREHLAFLREHDCDEAQGYYFSRPLHPDDCVTFLREHLRIPMP